MVFLSVPIDLGTQIVVLLPMLTEEKAPSAQKNLGP